MKKSVVENTTTNCDLQEAVFFANKVYTAVNNWKVIYSTNTSTSTKRTHADIFHISLLTVPELIFVTNITNYICGEISAFYTEFEQFMEFYSSLFRFFFSKYMWRIISAEKNLCGE